MRNEATELLHRSGAPRVLLDIAAGALRPPLTDYHLVPVPDSWVVPPELVDGRELVPIFSNADQYTLYCVDRQTEEIVMLDIEQPWPPLQSFRCWKDLAEWLVRVYEENQPDAAPTATALFADR